MGVIAITGTGAVRAELTGDDRAAELVLIPGGEIVRYQRGEGFADDLFQDVTAHFAENDSAVQLIRYRGELAPIAVADLAAFAVPILPLG